MQRNRVNTAPDAVSLQWANGKNEIRMTVGQGRYLAGIATWYSEVGKDEAFDIWCAARQIPQLEIRHPRTGAKPAEVRHWNLGERIELFPVTSGPVAATVAASLKPRAHAATVEAGIGIRWSRAEGERSKLAVRGYLRAAGDVYQGLVQISVRSRMTDELLAALVDHVRVCEVADSLIDRAKHPDVVQCYELALPLGAGAEEQWGRGETTTVYPIVSLHAAAPDVAALRELWRPESVCAAAVDDWPGVQAWAQDFSAGAEGELAREPQYEDAL